MVSMLRSCQALVRVCTVAIGVALGGLRLGSGCAYRGLA